MLVLSDGLNLFLFCPLNVCIGKKAIDLQHKLMWWKIKNTFYFYISPRRMESVQTADLDNRESNKVNKKLPTAPVMKEL